MKLSTARVERTLSQVDAQAIPDSHPAIPQLNLTFGDHTFFLADDGLSIVEPTAPTRDGKNAGMVVNIADWTDDSHSTLAAHEPHATDVIVVLGTEDEDLDS